MVGRIFLFIFLSGIIANNSEQAGELAVDKCVFNVAVLLMIAMLGTIVYSVLSWLVNLFYTNNIQERLQYLITK